MTDIIKNMLIKIKKNISLLKQMIDEEPDFIIGPIIWVFPIWRLEKMIWALCLKILR